MLTDALTLPVTSTVVSADMDGTEVLRCATPNTSALHISHGCSLLGRHGKRIGNVCQLSARSYTVLYYHTV